MGPSQLPLASGSMARPLLSAMPPLLPAFPWIARLQSPRLPSRCIPRLVCPCISRSLSRPTIARLAILIPPTTPCRACQPAPIASPASGSHNAQLPWPRATPAHCSRSTSNVRRGRQPLSPPGGPLRTSATPGLGHSRSSAFFSAQTAPRPRLWTGKPSDHPTLTSPLLQRSSRAELSKPDAMESRPHGVPRSCRALRPLSQPLPCRISALFAMIPTPSTRPAGPCPAGLTSGCWRTLPPAYARGRTFSTRLAPAGIPISKASLRRSLCMSRWRLLSSRGPPPRHWSSPSRPGRRCGRLGAPLSLSNPRPLLTPSKSLSRSHNGHSPCRTCATHPPLPRLLRTCPSSRPPFLTRSCSWRRPLSRAISLALAWIALVLLVS